MAVRSHRELIPKSVISHAQADLTILDQLSKNITRQGITNPTLNYLRVSGDIQHSLKQTTTIQEKKSEKSHLDVNLSLLIGPLIYFILR